jgi:hypothetical protein
LYFEILGANDEAINRAYLKAVAEEKLRRSNIAKERIDVDLSPVAKLRLIKDGYRFWIGKDKPRLSRLQVDRQATDQTMSFIAEQSEGESVPFNNLSDHAEELERFIFEFLRDRRDLQPFWHGENGYKFHLYLFPVVNELIRLRVSTFRSQGDSTKTSKFDKTIRDEIRQAKKRERKNPAYVAALDEVIEDLDRCMSSAPPQMPLVTLYSAEVRL